MNMYNDVVTFIEACDQKPSEENSKLYSNLITEEFTEFTEAYEQNDEVEMLDACMDMIWVILGFCHMKGYNVDGAWSEVRKTNLSKIDANTGKVIRRSDGKILKPEGWKEPNFSDFINKDLKV
jgi:predicted HAD superfamily Cof-like phosphohydrolase